MRMYSNHILTDSIHIGSTEFVLGVSVSVANQYITWKCRDTRHFEDAHVTSSLIDAQKDLIQRAQEEITRLEQLSLEQAPKRVTEIVL